jgi:hypothetical protein
MIKEQPSQEKFARVARPANLDPCRTTPPRATTLGNMRANGVRTMASLIHHRMVAIGQ